MGSAGKQTQYKKNIQNHGDKILLDKTEGF